MKLYRKLVGLANHHLWQRLNSKPNITVGLVSSSMINATTMWPGWCKKKRKEQGTL